MSFSSASTTRGPGRWNRLASTTWTRHSQLHRWCQPGRTLTVSWLCHHFRRISEEDDGRIRTENRSRRAVGKRGRSLGDFFAFAVVSSDPMNVSPGRVEFGRHLIEDERAVGHTRDTLLDASIRSARRRRPLALGAWPVTFPASRTVEYCRQIRRLLSSRTVMPSARNCVYLTLLASGHDDQVRLESQRRRGVGLRILQPGLRAGFRGVVGELVYPMTGCRADGEEHLRRTG